MCKIATKLQKFLCNFFVNITATLKLKQNNLPNSDINTVLFCLKNHNSISYIKKNYDETNEKILFQPVSLEEVEKVQKSLDIKKNDLSESIPAFILKADSNTYPNTSHSSW